MSITAAQVRAIAGTLGAKPRADLVAAIVKGWPAAVRTAKLTTSRRAGQFLAEIMTETGGLVVLSESGAYRYETILKIFGARQYSVPLGGRGHSAGITPDEAKRIAALPVAKRGPVLFDRVYGIGNPTKAKEFGHTKPGQGWIYRGGGMMQTTGLAGYRRRQKETGLPLVDHPELLHQPDTAFKTAYLTWAQDGRCNAAADRNDTVAVRKIINGGANGLAECKKYVAKAATVLSNYSAAPNGDDLEAEVEPVPLPTARPDIEEEIPPAPAPEPSIAPGAVDEDGDEVAGDPQLFRVQKRLKRRHYSPGKIDGRWGGGTRGALSAFMLDRGMTDHVPASLEEFHVAEDEVAAELTEAENEIQPDGSIGWFRPVTAERKAADPKVVEAIAPEVIPQKRSFLAVVWTAVSGVFLSIWTAISDYISQAWDFFTDNKHVVEEHPGMVKTAWSYVTAVPASAWLLLGSCGLAFVAYNIWSGIKEIRRSVSTGERQ